MQFEYKGTTNFPNMQAKQRNRIKILSKFCMKLMERRVSAECRISLDCKCYSEKQFSHIVIIVFLKCSYTNPTYILRISYVYPTYILRISYVVGSRKIVKICKEFVEK